MIPVIDVTGTAAQRGQSYGSQAADLIEKALGFYRADFAERGVDWQEAIKIAGSFQERIAAFDPIIATELEAIAKGASQLVEAIVLLNARTEVMFWHAAERRAAPVAPESEECTSVLAMPEVTRNGQLLHGQNWDWRPDVADHTIALRIRDADVPDALHFVEAGQLARHGLNRAGIAVTAMGLHAKGQYGLPGVPSPVVRRQMLQQETLGRAMGVAFSAPASFSHALIVSAASCNGEAAAFCLECAPEQTYWLEPEKGILSHANHFKHPATVAAGIELNLKRIPDTLYRDRRVYNRLAQDRGNITEHTLEAAFADRFAAPDAVLRAPDRRPGGLISATVYSLIMSPQNGMARLSLRPWEGSGYQQLQL